MRISKNQGVRPKDSRFLLVFIDPSRIWTGFVTVQPNRTRGIHSIGVIVVLHCSVAQSRPFDLLALPCWTIFSGGTKRLTFCFQLLWASEIVVVVLSFWGGCSEKGLQRKLQRRLMFGCLPFVQHKKYNNLIPRESPN